MASEKLMKARIQNKIETSENWGKATTFSPKLGEFVAYSDTNRIKIGDGVTNVNALPFLVGAENTYEFKEGNGSFTVTPYKGVTLTISIGKPSTAGTADKVSKALTVKVNNSDLYTYNGSAAKALNLIPGNNIEISSDTSGNVTITAKVASYEKATANADGLMSAEDKGIFDETLLGKNSIKINTISAPTSAGGTDYSNGTNGLVLKSDGNNVYWAADSNTDTKVTLTVRTTDGEFPILLRGTSAGTSTTTTTASFASGATINPSNGNITTTGKIKAESFEGNVSHAETADSANKVDNTFTITVDNGTIEGTDKFTFDGSVVKKINIRAGTNVTLTTDENGNLSISSKNTTYSQGTATKLGTTKLYEETGDNADGTMTQAAITQALANAGGGGGALYQTDTPSSAKVGELWFNPNNGYLQIYSGTEWQAIGAVWK